MHRDGRTRFGRAAARRHLRRAFASEAAFQLDRTILLGTRAGVPLGICNAPATIAAPKKNGQAAGTIVAENIADMWSRLPGPSRKRAVWIINEYAEAQLEQGTPSTPTSGMYFPQGFGGNPYPLIKGRPVLVAEQCPLLGAPGDIVLADLSQHLLFFAAGSNVIRADSKTLLAIDAAVGLEPDELAAKVAEAGAIAIRYAKQLDWNDSTRWRSARSARRSPTSTTRPTRPTRR
jgi:HK97 family phage major capsid protein